MLLDYCHSQITKKKYQSNQLYCLQSSSIRKTIQIYNSCVNTAAINNRGIAPLVSLIEKYGGWSVTGHGLNSWTVQEKMGHIQRDLNVQTLLSVSVKTDFMDSTRNILMVCKTFNELHCGMFETAKQPKNTRAIHPFRDPSSVCLKPKTSLNNKSKAPFRC